MKGAAVGETWKTPFVWALGETHNIQTEVQNKLVSLEGHLATIRQTIEEEQHGDDTSLKLLEVRGEIVFDLGNGLVQSADMTVKIITKPAADDSSSMESTIGMKIRRVVAGAKGDQKLPR